ncbi:MAG: hypothetical protein IJX46_05965 [Clostridia bacterium]|nr:hypothetical protein [Clostridia bacterium]
MKLTRKERGFLGLSLIFSACMLVIVFIITCIKKKNLLAALAAVAAIDVAAGCWFLHRTKKNNGYAFDFFDEDDYEIFDEEEAKDAEKAIYASFLKRRGTENAGRSAKPVYEIPVDEDASEEDFTK